MWNAVDEGQKMMNWIPRFRAFDTICLDESDQYMSE